MVPAVFQRLSALTVGLCFLVFLTTPALATITIESSGKRIPSTPDSLMGDVFDDEHYIPARLQFLPDNIDLCADVSHPHQTYQITVPIDRRPVVLLAQGAYCSDLAKARLASLKIQPAGVVKYLIIYDSRSTSTVLTDQAIHNEPEKMQSDETKQDHDSALAQALKTIRLGTPDTDLGKKKHSHVDPYVSVGVLHVKKAGGSTLMHELLNQTDETRQMGGPRLLLDGRSFDTAKFLRSLLFWVGLTIMVLGCCCSILLSARVQNLLDLEAETNQGPTRPTRRRMTPEQVEQAFPVERYQQGNEIVTADGTVLSAQLDQVDLSCCSICLDEYEPGDRIRRLPCGHVFHSTCIAKWLTERSCTCPLCKLDLLPEEREDDSDSENDDYVALPDGEGGTDNGNNQTEAEEAPRQESIWDLFIHVRNNMMQRQQQDEEGNVTAETNNNLQEPLLGGNANPDDGGMDRMNDDDDPELGRSGMVEMAPDQQQQQQSEQQQPEQ